MSSNTPIQPSTINVTVDGNVPDYFVRYAQTKVYEALVDVQEPILATRVVLSLAPDPSVQRPVEAEASIDINGTVIRAHAVTDDMHSAIDLLEERLRENLVQHRQKERTEQRRTGVPGEHQWRHGDLPTERPEHFPRPPEERKIIRRKSFILSPMTRDQAVWEMERLDHDFFLFTDASIRREALVFRAPSRHATAKTQAVSGGKAYQPVSYTAAAPPLTEEEAVTRIEISGEPFLFFQDPDSGRGRVLYIRKDGHYGLITTGR